MKLRTTVVSSILLNLETGNFCKEDFLVSFPEKSSNLAEIKFRANPTFTFTIAETYSNPLGAIQGGPKKLVSHESPGEYKNLQSKEHESIDSCINNIYGWTQRIQEELIAQSKITVDPEIDEIIENFHQKIDERVKDQESFFSSSEQAEILEKLNALQSRVEELESKYNFSAQGTAQIKSAIEKTQKDLPYYPKGIWYKTATSKIVSALKTAIKTKEVRDFALEAAKKFLL